MPAPVSAGIASGSGKRWHQVAQYLQPPSLRSHAQADAECRPAQHQQPQCQTDRMSRWRAQAAQDRHLVDAAQGNGWPPARSPRRQAHRQQRAQAEEAPGKIKGLAHAALGVVHAQQAKAFTCGSSHRRNAATWSAEPANISR